uniref:Uncharacterized protein n=1 Tax=Rhizophora mucronata TaxID=61149 RepID=A0A2P2QCH2_RHIMU
MQQISPSTRKWNQEVNQVWKQKTVFQKT